MGHQIEMHQETKERPLNRKGGLHPQRKPAEQGALCRPPRAPAGGAAPTMHPGCVACPCYRLCPRPQGSTGLKRADQPTVVCYHFQASVGVCLGRASPEVCLASWAPQWATAPQWLQCPGIVRDLGDLVHAVCHEPNILPQHTRARSYPATAVMGLGSALGAGRASHTQAWVCPQHSR